MNVTFRPLILPPLTVGDDGTAMLQSWLLESATSVESLRFSVVTSRLTLPEAAVPLLLETVVSHDAASIVKVPAETITSPSPATTSVPGRTVTLW